MLSYANDEGRCECKTRSRALIKSFSCLFFYWQNLCYEASFPKNEARTFRAVTGKYSSEYHLNVSDDFTSEICWQQLTNFRVIVMSIAQLVVCTFCEAQSQTRLLECLTSRVKILLRKVFIKYGSVAHKNS